MDYSSFNDKNIIVASVKYTKKEYLKLYKLHTYVIPRYVHIAIYFILFTILSILLYLDKNAYLITLDVLSVCIYTMLIIIYPFIYNNLAKKRNIGFIVEYIFHDNYFEAKTKEMDKFEKIKYYNLYKICETRTNFYLYIDKRRMYIIPKKRLTGNIQKLRGILKKNIDRKKYINLI